MKLKFELKKAQIPNLYKLLQLTSQIWKNDEKIYFYFDTDQVIIYPESRQGFDKIFARIHITAKDFFSSYQIKSQKEKSAILISPHQLSSFMGDLKVLDELGYDALFKLAQCTNGETGQVQKYLEITGFVGSTGLGMASSVAAKEGRGETVRSFVQIDAHFDKALFPEQIEEKEVEFDIDLTTCCVVLRKFRDRISVLNDELATISFRKDGGPSEEGGDPGYQLQLKSKHMKTIVKNREYSARFNGSDDKPKARPKYKIPLKKEIFLRFFQVLKLGGSALLKVNHCNMIEMAYTLEKNNHL